MGEFDYKLKVDIVPSSGRPGDSVTIKAVFSDIMGQIKNVYVSVPQYGIWEMLWPTGKNIYSLSYTIPWEAPSGNYDVRIYAINADGERGPATTVTFNIA